MMPLPGTPGILYFEGANISDFIERFEDICDDYQVRDKNKIKRVPRYYTQVISQFVKGIKKYQDEDWGKLKKELKKEYRADNITQQMNTRQFLETLINKPRGIKEAANYCRQYATISRKLKTAGKLDEYTQYQLFVRGLPDKTRKEIFLHHYIDPDGETAPQFKKMLKMATNITVSERRMQEFIKKKENGKMSELINKYDRKSLVVKKKKYTVPVVKIVVGALSASSS